ncbi:thiolase family protein [Verrucomicrobium spinosum]|uniref:thiolase family protein n=2 Tax=Verrucomicrobium spinosum TaxID=2736 RepID=UPI000174690C|nr:thiolase family protein [Verrucomicrobium spinosum]
MNASPLVIVAGARTPFCRAGSTLADFDAVELGRHAASGLFTRTGIDPAAVDETVFGCVSQPANAANIARVIALRAGVPKERPAMTVHRNCASGMEAVTTAQEKLAAGQGEVFLVGGTESMSQMPLLFRHEAAIKFALLSRARGMGGKLQAATAFRPQDFLPLLAIKMGLTDPVAEINMGQTAELLAREFEISRDAQDAMAVRSQLLAAQHRGHLREEIAPMFSGRKDLVAVEDDNGVRTDSSPAKLAKLQPIFEPLTGTVTAGNSSQVTDGAVALLACSEARAQQLGVAPLGRLVSHAYTGCDPERMGLGPVTAMAAALGHAGWKLSDVDIIEINEAFAAQILAVLKCLKDPASARKAGLNTPLGEVDDSQLNLQGGAIALGHPVGATGARLILTALYQLRRAGKRRALVSLCVGGGQGGAVCLEAF